MDAPGVIVRFTHAARSKAPKRRERATGPVLKTVHGGSRACGRGGPRLDAPGRDTARVECRRSFGSVRGARRRAVGRAMKRHDSASRHRAGGHTYRLKFYTIDFSRIYSYSPNLVSVSDAIALQLHAPLWITSAPPCRIPPESSSAREQVMLSVVLSLSRSSTVTSRCTRVTSAWVGSPNRSR